MVWLAKYFILSSWIQVFSQSFWRSIGSRRPECSRQQCNWWLCGGTGACLVRVWQSQVMILLSWLDLFHISGLGSSLGFSCICLCQKITFSCSWWARGSWQQHLPSDLVWHQNWCATLIKVVFVVLYVALCVTWYFSLVTTLWLQYKRPHTTHQITCLM